MPSRPARPLSRTVLAVLPVLVLVIAVAPTASAMAAAGRAAPASGASSRARAAAAARAALQRLAIGQHATDHRVAGPGHRPSPAAVSSSNWAGYADTGSGYRTVTGSWAEPSVSCGSRTSLAAFWVGLDGYSSATVEQDGTLAECYLGSAYYYTWWEMYPSNAIQVVGTTVSPGDLISASVIRSGTSYTLSVTDSANPANSFSTTQTCSSCANSSAEWIAEAPSGSAGLYPLADFHSWTENDATVANGLASGAIATFPHVKIIMVDSSGLVKATTSALNSSGNGFTVTWKRST